MKISSLKILLFVFILFQSLIALAFNATHLPSFFESDKDLKHHTLIFGGSFNPPTKGHLNILIKTMRERGINKAILLVDFPYKKTSWPKEVPLYLTRLMIEHLDEYLNEQGIHFANFRSKNFGDVLWDEDNTSYEIKVSNRSILNEGKKIPLENFQDLIHEENLKPNEVWALFGADCLESIHKWQKGISWFHEMNFIVYNRLKEKNENFFDFKKEDPLLEVIDNSINLHAPVLKDSNFRIYQKEKSGPIVILFPETGGDISSTIVRDALKNKNNTTAQSNLTPTIFKEIKQFHLYESDEKEKLTKNLISSRPLTKI